MGGAKEAKPAGQPAATCSLTAPWDQRWLAPDGLTPLCSGGGGTGRGLRGGTFGDDNAEPAYRNLLLGVPPTYSAAVSGFRVALVPEPQTYAMLAMGLVAVVLAKRRAQQGIHRH